MMFAMKDFFSKCVQIPRKLLIWSYLLKKPLTGNFSFCAVANSKKLTIYKRSFQSKYEKKFASCRLHSLKQSLKSKE